MGKKSKSHSEHRNGAKSEANGDAEVSSKPRFLASDAPFDPLVASLFEKSAGPVQTPSVHYTDSAPLNRSSKRGEPPLDGDSDDSSNDQNQSDSDGDHEMQDVEKEEGNNAGNVEVDNARTSRKRKRAAADNLEDVYMQKIAREEQKEEAKRKVAKSDENGDNDDDSTSQGDDSSDDNSPPPMHESLTGERVSQELDKSSKTVFLGNVSNAAIRTRSARKTLLKHISSFLGSLPKSDTPHKVESIRFRSTAYGTKLGVPRRAAYAHKEVMDATTASTNAYVVFSTKLAAQKAPSALNGTVVLDRHLRVDSVAHPSPIDNKRCVFVGNLDFVDQENTADEDGESAKKKTNSTPADVEEGLWRVFNSHTGPGGQKNAGGGNVESVRVVRDQATRVGKGFAYVQFFDSTCVEAALLLDGKKFPPLLPRKLRVVRAKKINKKRESERRFGGRPEGNRDTLSGRSSKLLGRAGAAKLRESASSNSFVFEGQRAVEGSGRLKVKTKSRGASKAKRSSRRAAAYRASGGKSGKRAGK